MTLKITAAQAIANSLAAEGCRHVFGMPGGEVLVLLEALSEAGIEFTLCKHENNAGFMAEGSWHATGAPGILLTTIGPGLANGINSIANAFQEQVPLIVLSGCIGPTGAEQFTHQVIDQSALLAPITKAQFKVTEGTAAIVIEKALSIAMADPPGPVHIDLPDTLARDLVEPLRISARVRENACWPDGVGRARAKTMLQKAKRPIILAGVGAVLHGAGPALKALVETHNIPLVTTYKAKGIFPESHDLALGGHGLSPLSDKTILPLMRQSDCVILAGFDPIEMRSDWIQPWDADVAIELTHSPVEHGMHSSAVRFIGDVTSSVQALCDDQPVALQDLWDEGEIMRAKAILKGDFSTKGKWGPHAVFDVINNVVSDDTIVTADSGAHRILLSQMIKCAQPSTFLQSAAFCTMGISIPLAMGYKKAAPERAVIAVVGDAGFDMTAGELATLRDMNLPVVIVVLVDESLALIEKKQALMQLKNFGVTFGPSDFSAIARAYGGIGKTASNTKGLKEELEHALSRECFVVISCPIDKRHYDNAF